ncbi:EI24 domain-containing protein [Paenalcaligenes sp. Me131]|uniref:EI24 domain-containing protein n=1 Tax=Paenalcaligenes sp. Me131 TaxID=3392636 RepID=UPI003D2C8ACC
MTTQHSFSSSVGRVLFTLKQAAVSQLHPKMLAALLLPIVVALVGVIIMLWTLWTPLSLYVGNWMNHSEWLNQTDGWFAQQGWLSWFSLSASLIPIIVVLIIFPASGALGMIVASIFVMPLALAHVQQKYYPDLKQESSNATLLSVSNAISVGIIFMVGWVLTMPLWLIPFLGFLVPLFWGSFLFTRLLRMDSLVEHADGAERDEIMAKNKREYWLLGLAMALLNFLPPAWLVLPVFSALAFSHFSLQQLHQLRSQERLTRG